MANTTKKTMTLSDHIEMLARENGITVLPGKSKKGRSNKRDKTIKTQPVNDPATYAQALHLLGHVVGPLQSKSSGRLLNESGAWQWAIANALDEMLGNEEFLGEVQKSFDIYAKWALEKWERGVRTAPKLPAEDDPFWTMPFDMTPDRKALFGFMGQKPSCVGCK